MSSFRGNRPATKGPLSFPFYLCVFLSVCLPACLYDCAMSLSVCLSTTRDYQYKDNPDFLMSDPISGVDVSINSVVRYVTVTVSSIDR